MPLSKNSAHSETESVAWEHDVLGREKVAKHLTPLLASIRQPFVISLDAPYGGGKTYFLQNWKRDLEAAGYLVIYFNAWETDYSEDPLLVFIASINRQLSALQTSTLEKQTKSVLKKASKFGEILFQKAGPLVVREFVRRRLGDDGLDELKNILDDETEKDIAKLVGNEMGKVLAKHSETEEATEKFRVALQETLKDLTASLEDDKSKLIVFVDELDRCRPTYAVELLERIKHFFAVEGMVFVLGVHGDQIANAMSAVYGAKLDTDGYLRRFFDWRFQLPKPSAIEYAKILSRRFGINDLPGVWGEANFQYYSLDGFILSFGVVSEALSLTLRQQEQIFTEANLFLRTLDKNMAPLSMVLGVLLPLRADNLEMFESAFTPQTPGSLQLDGVRGLFEYLRGKIMSIGGLERFGHWSNWQEFEGCFLSWFIDSSRISDVGRIASEHNKKFNSMSGVVVEYEQKKKIEYEYDVWTACNSEISIIYSSLFKTLRPSLADIVRQRLNNAGKFIIWSDESH